MTLTLTLFRDPNPNPNPNPNPTQANLSDVLSKELAHYKQEPNLALT